MDEPAGQARSQAGTVATRTSSATGTTSPASDSPTTSFARDWWQNSGQKTWWILGAIALFLLLINGNDAEERYPQLSERIKQVEGLSTPERQRLEQQLDEFLALPEETQGQLQQLIVAIEADPALQKTATSYGEFLENLSPWERQQLVSMTDVDEKLQAVTRLQAREQQREQARQQEKLEADRAWSEVIEGSGGRSFGGGMSDRNRHGKQILQSLLAQLPPEVQARLSLSEDDPAYPMNVLATILEHYSTRPDFKEEPIPRDVLEKVAKSLPDEGRLLGSIEKDGPRRVVAFMASQTKWYWIEKRRGEKINREELLSFRKSLSPKLQADFDKREAVDSSEALSRLRLAWFMARLSTEGAPLEKWMKELGLDREHRRPGDGGRRPGSGGGRPGEPRPGGGRPGGEGRPDEQRPGGGPNGDGRPFKGRPRSDDR